MRTFDGELLDLMFLNAAVPKIGDASGLQPSAVAGNYYFRFCTDASVVSDAAIGTECAYTGYVAGGVAVPRTAAGFSRTDNVVTNVADVLADECTAGSENIRYVELWKTNTGSTEAERIDWMQLPSDIPVSVGSIPRIAAGLFTYTYSHP